MSASLIGLVQYLDSGLDSWTGQWTEIWTGFWTDAMVHDDHFQPLTVCQDLAVLLLLLLVHNVSRIRKLERKNNNIVIQELVKMKIKSPAFSYDCRSRPEK